MKTLTVDAIIENVRTVTAFVDEQLEAIDCPIKAQMQIDVAIDEMFSNIAYYAYEPEIGEATIQLEVLEEPRAVKLTFIDNGKPYDPLKSEDPNTELSAEERKIGGWGIYMVKNIMDEVFYEYTEGQNKLSIVKYI